VEFTNNTFPQVAIPIVPTIRVLVTFTKFEELQPLEEFTTPPSSPDSSKSPAVQSSGSWIQWIKAPYRQNFSTAPDLSSRVEDIQDPFVIPSDYTWMTPEEKKKKTQENKNKSKKGRNRA
jgi:ankyrin repeat domain-containing protein 13